MTPLSRLRIDLADASPALAVIIPIACVVGVIITAATVGRAAIEPIVGAALLLLAGSVQGRWTAFVLAVAAGWLIHG